GQVPVPFVVVQAVADHEHGGDLEARVADVQRDALRFDLVQQCADLQALRPPRAQVLQQVVQREARVHDVLDQQDVAAGDLVVEVLQDPDHARGLGGRPVGRHGHEVELHRQLDVPGQVGHQD